MQYQIKYKVIAMCVNMESFTEEYLVNRKIIPLLHRIENRVFESINYPTC
jgi:hypothetical protein